ncbi:MAG TPA: DUF4258 domain-containing protein [Ktedonobacterales bacterium]
MGQKQRIVTLHAALELDTDGLDALDVWASILAPAAETVEDYPTDPRGPSCLILSFVASQPVHTVIAYPAKRQAAKQGLAAVAVLITAYCPDKRPHEWSADYRQRLPQP